MSQNMYVSSHVYGDENIEMRKHVGVDGPMWILEIGNLNVYLNDREQLEKLGEEVNRKLEREHGHTKRD